MARNLFRRVDMLLVCSSVIWAIAWTASAHGACALEFSGADHLERRDPRAYAALVDHLAEFVAPARPAGHVISVFGPDEIESALRAAGASETAVLTISNRVKAIFPRVTRSTTRLLYDVTQILIDHHRAADTRVHICVLQAGCPEFTVRGLARPGLAVGVLAGVHVVPLGGALPNTPPTELGAHVALVRAGGDPELLTADLFTGLGSGAITHLIEIWAQFNLRRPGSVAGDALFNTFGRLQSGRAYVDHRFVEFMKVMAGHRALTEYLTLVPLGTVSPVSLRHPGRPTTPSAAFAAMSAETRAFLFARGVIAGNAAATFDAWYDSMVRRIYSQ